MRLAIGRIIGDQLVAAALLVVGIVESGGHRRTQQDELGAWLEQRSLPDAGRHHDLGLLAAQDVRAEDDLPSRAVREELEHPHRSAQVDVEDLFRRQAVHLRERLGRQQVVDRRPQRSRALGPDSRPGRPTCRDASPTTR